MPGTASVARTTNQDVNGLLSGVRWGTTNLTYSAPASATYYGSGYGSGEPTSGFEALNATQQAAVGSILRMYEAVTNLAFTPVTESATTHGDLRFAMSDVPGTAWGYYPSAAAAGGDSWYRNAGSYYDNPVRGNYAYDSFMHEIGHTLSLKHGQDGSGYGAMTAAHDSMEYSVMTYRSYVGDAVDGGYTNEAWGYAQTLMTYDVAAVQAMYGADFTTNAGNTTYTWSPTTGQSFVNGVGQGAPGGNRVFMTVWDGGGTDTYDLSNYATAVTVDLRPGEWTTTSAVQRAYLGDGHYAAGNVANALLYNGDVRSLIENAVGGAGNDLIYGNAAGNRLDGRGGSDTVVLAGVQADYAFAGAEADFTATGFGATDTILNAEYIKFLGSGATVAVGGLIPATVVATPADDFRDGIADTTAALGTVGVGGAAQAGSIEVLGDADLLRVTLEAGEVYRFDLRGLDSGAGTLADPSLFLRDAAGSVVAQDADGGAGLDSQITFTAAASGTYYLDVQANGGTGSYALSAVELDDYRDTIADPTLGIGFLGVGGAAQTGTIEGLGDADVFGLMLGAGQTYRFDLRGLDSGAGTLADPSLFLRNSAGSVVAQDADGGAGRDAQITFTPRTSGLYYLDAQASGGTGNYVLGAATA